MYKNKSVEELTTMQSEAIQKLTLMGKLLREQTKA